MEIGGRFLGTVGVNDNDLLMDLKNMLNHDTFHIMSTDGSMDVAVSLDGTNFSTVPLSLTDQGSTATAPVIATAANRVYGFRGKYARIQVRQNGATAVTDPTMTYGSM